MGSTVARTVFKILPENIGGFTKNIKKKSGPLDFQIANLFTLTTYLQIPSIKANF